MSWEPYWSLLLTNVGIQLITLFIDPFIVFPLCYFNAMLFSRKIIWLSILPVLIVILYKEIRIRKCEWKFLCTILIENSVRIHDMLDLFTSLSHNNIYTESCGLNTCFVLFLFVCLLLLFVCFCFHFPCRTWQGGAVYHFLQLFTEEGGLDQWYNDK